MRGTGIPEDVDRNIERAGRKGHKYVKRSFENRRERLKRKWLARAGDVIESFREYLEKTLGCER
ncbi:MAG TPA: hypothetical protein EYH23_01610 [Euryarchaeota archaeon]|nr:hypothetical protein [Euryarchaeota archaeon]